MSHELTPHDLALAQAIAREVIALLDARKGTRDVDACPLPQKGLAPLVSVRELAEALGVGRRFVYEHSEMLGAVRLGVGPKAPLRFDLEAAKSAISCSSGLRSEARNASEHGESGVSRGRRPRRVPVGLPKASEIFAADRGDDRAGAQRPDVSSIDRKAA